KTIGGDFDVAHGVFLDAVIHWDSSPVPDSKLPHGEYLGPPMPNLFPALSLTRPEGEEDLQSWDISPELRSLEIYGEVGKEE
ncbi:MAG: hypothetical protein CBC13_07970, partial [Planctomycetia bacterium TMED53]